MKTTMSEIKAYYNTYVLPSSPRRTLLTVHCHAPPKTTPSEADATSDSDSESSSSGSSDVAEVSDQVLEPTPEVQPVQEEYKQTKIPVVVDDIRSFRERQTLAPRKPVKPLSDFMDGAVKLIN
jgi:hypothetical protein